MKKFVGKFLLFSIPFALVFAWFLAFEPYDYFGIRGGTNYGNKQIYEMRRLLREQPTHIILGDSRMAHLDDDLVYELSGEHYLNLAFGGATLHEIIELFYYADEHTDLEKVYIGVSFYTINGAYVTDRVNPTLPIVLDPVLYISTISSYSDVVTNMNRQFDILEYYFENGSWPPDETYQLPLSERDINYDENGNRNDMLAFTLSNILPTYPMGRFNVGESYMDRLKELSLYCEENDIEIIAVFPPVHQTYWDIAINDRGFAEDVAEYKEELLPYFDAIDMEWESEFVQDDTLFFDPFHLYEEYYDNEFTKVLFTDYTPEYVIRHTK